MRITQSMLANNSLRHLSNTYGRMGKLQDQLNTGKKINRPSDDPVSAMKGLTYRTNVAQVEQFKRNFTEAHNWIDNSDAALDKATLAMQRIRELTVNASNGTLDESQRKMISEEIKQIKEHLGEIANTQVGDKYLFNGTDTDKKPVDFAAGTYPSNSDAVEIELSKGITIQVNVAPKDIFSKDFFDSIDNLITDIEAPDGDVGQHLAHMDTQINHILTERATLGARDNRIELMEQRVDQQEAISKKMMSDNEDIEYEKVISEFIIEESLLRASLSVGSRIVQPTLVDFLR